MIFKKYLIFLSAILSAAEADCFDGNNFGCSHFCSGSICSCPPCWVLGEDGKTCRFEAGKAQVVCSANGAEVTIDKCAVPDVDPATIHLKDTACSATEENENTWKVVTGFADCGSEFGFAEEKLTLQNSLMIGPSIVAGRQQSRKFKIAFSCSYNDDVQASSTIRANDVLFEGVRFDINDAQPIDFSFGFALDFYKSKEFTTLASDGQFQPGSPLFVKVVPTSALSDALEFSVNKCTVKDEVISQSADILNTCPVTGTNFEFLPVQKDYRLAVKFTYKSFIFAASDTTAEINLSCDIKL
ncbi:unnamed protein product [Oikopleura dioica]|uniref:ZP domain-containing protein n=1 Tax=Oikopleura dioica TaxID=34765 RepID=E4WTX8_OIKDI|nr:unnamed protein product [Oikopleura dioica]